MNDICSEHYILMRENEKIYQNKYHKYEIDKYNKINNHNRNKKDKYMIIKNLNNEISNNINHYEDEINKLTTFKISLIKELINVNNE